MLGHVIAVISLSGLLLLAVGLVVIHRINAATRSRGRELDERAARAESSLAQLEAPERRRARRPAR